jgi:GT2 family glycosyltransferase
MSGNLMVRREHALSVGGFDENYTPPVSYRFDSDFAKRVVKAGGQIEFVPGARIYHLRTPTGGTRSNSSHLTSASPEHGVGDYYFALRHAKGVVRWRHILQRPVREISTRFHLRHPWYIPVKLTGEVRALVAAWRLHRRNPGLLRRQGVP